MAILPCGVDQLVDRQAHNLKAAGSSPASASSLSSDVAWFLDIRGVKSKRISATSLDGRRGRTGGREP